LKDEEILNLIKYRLDQAQIALQGKKNKTMADQIATVSKLRLIDQIGKLSEEDMRKVERAVHVQLGLPRSIEKG